MLLAIDAGNTNIVMAVYDGDEQLSFERAETDADIENIFQQLRKQYPDIQDVVVSSVVPSVNDSIATLSAQIFQSEAVFADYQSIDITIDLDTPSEVGADRLVNAIAVMAEYQKPAIILDFGTATTFDVVDEQGRYAGGVIAPGINLSLEALHQAAAKLPDVPIEKPDNVIGKNTVHAMQSGLYWGYIGMIEGTLERMKKEMEGDPLIIATGGLAPLFTQGTDMIERYDAHLTMKGLVNFYKTQ